MHRSKSLTRRTFSLLIDQVLLWASLLRRESRNQFLDAAGNEGPGYIKILANRGAFIPTLSRLGRREPPSFCDPMSTLIFPCRTLSIDPLARRDWYQFKKSPFGLPRLTISPQYA
jgi:hypothetical protein